MNELLESEESQAKQTDVKAWQLALECKQWIWKSIHNRKIPQEDQEDCYSICLIEVQRVMKIYNPKYSKVAWARWGVLRGFLIYDSGVGSIRLPIHIVEKINKLNKYRIQMETNGRILTTKEMSDYIGAGILSVISINSANISSGKPESTADFFYNTQTYKDDATNDIVNGHQKTIVEIAVFNSQKEVIYERLHKLTDEEIFILTLRFNLDPKRIPKRDCFTCKNSIYNLKSFSKNPKIHLLREINIILGRSREAIRQNIMKATDKLK